MKIPRSLKLAPDTDKIVQALRKRPEHKRSFNSMVEYLIENSPAYVNYTKAKTKNNHIK